MNLDWHYLLGLIALFAAAAAACAILIVVLRPLLARYALARPNRRSSHTVPTPQGGGIAVIAAAIGLSAMTLKLLSPLGLQASVVVLAASALIAVVGAVDDIRIIAAGPRLILQALLVGAVIAALPGDMRVFGGWPWWLERALLLVGGLWFVNLVNFMDGIDWITVVETLCVTAGLVVLGLMGALPPYGIVIAVALGGAILGFAPFNRPVATLFLGDVGSLPIGLLLGWLLLLLAGDGHLAAAVLLPLYYLTDATLTLLRRVFNRERIWEAHRSHFYQHATARGFTPLEVVSRIFAVNLALIALAVLTVVVNSRTAHLIALAAGGILVGWLLRLFARGRAA